MALALVPESAGSRSRGYAGFSRLSRDRTWRTHRRIPMTDPYEDFGALRIEHSEPGVVRIVLDGPGLNAVGSAAHRELADVWRTVDSDSETRVAVLTGAGNAFSAGGSFE